MRTELDLDAIKALDLESYLTGADLTGANLTGANLTRANLTGATLTDANLTRATGNEWTRLPVGWKVSDGFVVRDA